MPETELEGKLWAELQTAHAHNRELERANAALKSAIVELERRNRNQAKSIRWFQRLADKMAGYRSAIE